MKSLRILKSALVGGASVLTLVNPATAKVFNVPDGDLATALSTYIRQSGVQLMYMDDAVRGRKSRGAKGDYTEIAALTQILRGTGFTALAMPSSIIDIVPQEAKPMEKLAQAAPRRTPTAPVAPAIETVVVTAQHKSENIQQVPISITALSQQQLTDRQIAGGPDLLRDVPNMNFGKTNFSGYSIELRGIGTQAISVTTDPAVAVAFNDIPFIRNHFFEQEFFDLQDAEVLRGPQGTLYGRNATAGVVNLKSALPTDQFEAMASVDIGNYMSRRYEGMINLPISGDQFDIRMAGEWTKRDGYTLDSTLNTNVDGRDLWSGRITIGWKPSSDVQTYLVWEHFSEDDNRLRSGKQLCKTDPVVSSILGVDIAPFLQVNGTAYSPGDYLTQGCQMTSLYSPGAFEVPNGYSLPYYSPLSSTNVPVRSQFDPYASTTQSTNLRSIESAILPTYRAKNDTVEFNVDYRINSVLTLTSQTGYNNDFLWSTEDYNRFDSAPGAFETSGGAEPGLLLPDPLAGKNGVPGDSVIFCDPQLGCSDKLIAEDLDEEHAWQASQEFRLASNFAGPLNFSAGANYLHYETEESYYVFINSLSLAAAYKASGASGGGHAALWQPGVSTNAQCLSNYGGYAYNNPSVPNGYTLSCIYIDPNPIGSLNNQGHNYFLSQNPYILNSYAIFGEAYFNVTNNLKLTTGLRWTDDQKHFTDIPSELLVTGYGYPVTGIVNQQWDQWTGREVLDWTPTLSFTDQSLFYASYSHGYKAGGANPPGAVFPTGFDAEYGQESNPIHPLTFKPEFIEAFELGTKNTMLGGALTLNGDVFYYNYTGYQISEIVDRSAINNNYNAHIEGAELETNWEPLPGLRFNFAGGWEDTVLAGGSQGVDLMDRAAGNPNWLVVKPFPTQASNCIVPAYLVLYQLTNPATGIGVENDCAVAYTLGQDPVTGQPYVANPVPGYPGFNPLTAPNGGEGIDKNLSKHALPNAPPLTVSLGGQYSMPVWTDWAATLRADFYWQADSWARVFNDNPYDRIHGYTNLNLALIFASDDGWQVMGYVKNVFNTTAITGDFLNSDDSGLTTNVFLTDPRLYGVRVTKDFGAGDSGAMLDIENDIADFFADKDGRVPSLWIEFGVQSEQLGTFGAPFSPSFVMTTLDNGLGSLLKPQEALSQSFGGEAKMSYQPSGTDWVLSASVRYGRANGRKDYHYQTQEKPKHFHFYTSSGNLHSGYTTLFNKDPRVADEQASNHEFHSIVDFEAGQDIGLGIFGDGGTSVLSGGIRIAQFMVRQGVIMHADPDYTVPPNILYQYVHHHTYSAQSSMKRSFHGIGPSISWNASVPVTSDASGSGISLNWAANGAMLFGRQDTQGHHQVTSQYFRQRFVFDFLPPVTAHSSGSPNRRRAVVVPNLGGMFGVSYRFNNAKVSLGYRADEYFGAMDGGIDTRRSENVGFFGPYANISIGLGG